MNKEFYDKLCLEVMDTFDFGRVEKAMEALEWTWIGVQGQVTQRDLRKQARRIMKEVYDFYGSEPITRVGMGGFKFEADWQNESVELMFCVDNVKVAEEDLL